MKIQSDSYRYGIAESERHNQIALSPSDAKEKRLCILGYSILCLENRDKLVILVMQK